MAATVTDQPTEEIVQARTQNDSPHPASDERSFVLGSIFFFLIIFSPFFFFLYLKFFGFIKEREENALIFRYPAMQWLGAISIAAGFGALGVWTSFLSRRKDLLEPARIKFDWTIVLAYLLGCVLGIIFLLLFIGNFLSGNLFPAISSGGDPAFIASTIHFVDWAKIMIWCFISGFSERLIPNMLDNLVTKAAAGSDPHRSSN
jgi:hypothetical protein